MKTSSHACPQPRTGSALYWKTRKAILERKISTLLTEMDEVSQELERLGAGDEGTKEVRGCAVSGNGLAR